MTEAKQKAHYVFVVSTQMGDDGSDIPASHIFDRLVRLSKWFLSQYTPFRDAYQPGDRVLFYLAGARHRFFAGHATIAGTPVPTAKAEAAALAELGLFGYDRSLPLTGLALFSRRHPMRELVDRLEFIKDKRNYGLNLRQGAIRVSPKDYAYVVNAHS
jgi:hypothetical protein